MMRITWIFFFLTQLAQANPLSPLLASKYLLLNGELKKAEIFLDGMQGEQKEINLQKNYYWSLIDFIRGNYQDAYRKLVNIERESPRKYDKICALKIIVMRAPSLQTSKKRSLFRI